MSVAVDARHIEMSARSPEIAERSPSHLVRQLYL
jgi:hypothetical protein